MIEVTKNIRNRENLALLDNHPKEESLRSYTLDGLAAHPKRLASKFLYDKRGSELFDKICHQPEYYQTDAEIEVLEKNGAELVNAENAPVLLVELGSGHSRKIRNLLQHLPAGSHFVPLDISGEFLLDHAERVAIEFSNINVTAICADFLQPIPIPDNLKTYKNRTAFFPGSTIGNFEPATQQRILKNICDLLGKGGRLVIGVDRKNPRPMLEAAYNDKAGITAAFEMNILTRINRELGANFDPNEFFYQGSYNEEAGRVEMYLVSRSDQDVEIEGEVFHFHKNEKIHVENSYKYEPHEFAEQCAPVGLQLKNTWTDKEKRFHVYLLEVQ